MASVRRSLVGVHRIFRCVAASRRSSVAAPPPSYYSEALLSPQSGWVSHFPSSGDGGASDRFLDIDISNEESKRRWCNRLLYRSRQRGFLELDLVLGKWVVDNIDSVDVNGIKALIGVLDLMYLFCSLVILFEFRPMRHGQRHRVWVGLVFG